MFVVPSSEASQASTPPIATRTRMAETAVLAPEPRTPLSTKLNTQRWQPSTPLSQAMVKEEKARPTYSEEYNEYLSSWRKKRSKQIVKTIKVILIYL